MKFVKQTAETANLMNSWLNDNDIVKFAMFDSTFTDELNYYNTKEAEEGLLNTYLNAIYDNDNLVGYTVIHYYIDENEEYGYTINPIVINPLYQNQSFGKKALEKIIDGLNYDYVDYIEAVISRTNYKSIRLFESFGFIPLNDENNMITYRLKK